MIQICDITDVADDRGLKVDVDGVGTLAVFRFDGTYFVVDDKCTHGLGSLSTGKIVGNQVICPFHRGAFNFTTGEATVRPCVAAVRTYPAQLVGTTLFIPDPANAACD